MDRTTFSKWGSLICVVLVVAIMVSFTTPFGKFITTGAQTMLSGLTASVNPPANTTPGETTALSFNGCYICENYSFSILFFESGTGEAYSNGAFIGNVSYEYDEQDENVVHLSMLSDTLSFTVSNGGSTLTSIDAPDMIFERQAEPSAGLYKSGTNHQVLLASWSDLVDSGVIRVENGLVYTNYNTSTWTNDSADALAGDLVLPDDGSITAIGDPFGIVYEDGTEAVDYNCGFLDCNKLTSITLPSSMNAINCCAFMNCSSLSYITIPSGVIDVGQLAFAYCSSLTSVYIPDSVANIHMTALGGCQNLTNITVSSANTVYHSSGNCLIETDSKTLVVGCNTSVIPADGSVTSVGEHAFAGRTGLTSIEIPAGVTTIGHGAFMGAGLTNVEIPAGVTSIGKAAFHSCSGLTSVTFEEGSQLTTIGDIAFYLCESLTSINIPDGVTHIGNSAFGLCEELISVTIPDSVTYIVDETFNGCYKLESIDIHDNVTSIGDYAFMCSGLTSIEIPESVTIIGEMAFYECTNLTNITYAGTMSDWTNNVTKDVAWHSNVPATEVVCSDGTVLLN